MSQYTAGTVTLNTSSETVTGSGTAFLTNVAAGDVFSVIGSKVPYFVGSVDSDTQLTLTGAYAGTSGAGQSYAITTSLTPANSIPYMEYGDSDTPTIFKAAMTKIDTLLNALATGTAGAVLFLGSAGAIASDYAGISFNSTTDKLTVGGALTITGALSGVTTITAAGTIGTSHTSAGATAAYLYNLSATGFGSLVRGGGGTTEYIAQWLRYDGSERMTLTNTGLALNSLALSGVTTLAASGAISSTVVDANFATVLGATTASTGAKGVTLQNTGGTANFAIEKSSGSYVVNGSTGYDAIVNGSVGVSIGVNSTLVGRFSSAGLALNSLALTGVTTLTFDGAGASRATGGIRIGADSTNNLIDDASTGAGTATLYIGNASINVTSDERVKTNVREWNGDASAILNALPVKAWDAYTESAPQGGYTGGYVGFTAQDLYKAAPWAVNTQGDTGLPWQARYEFLNGIIVKGWQSHESQIQSLTARLAKAESALAANGITLQ